MVKGLEGTRLGRLPGAGARYTVELTVFRSEAEEICKASINVFVVNSIGESFGPRFRTEFGRTLVVLLIPLFAAYLSAQTLLLPMDLIPGFFAVLLTGFGTVSVRNFLQKGTGS